MTMAKSEIGPRQRRNEFLRYRAFRRVSFGHQPAFASVSCAKHKQPKALQRRNSFRHGVWGLILLLAPVTQAEKQNAQTPLRAVITGGGPTLQYNQAAIESNVRYVNKLLPPDAIRTTLFADGNGEKATVQVEDKPAEMTNGEFLFDLALNDPNETGDSGLHYRRPNLGAKLDGPATSRALNTLFSDLARELTPSPKPLFLYFTGHGGAGGRDEDNNVYSLWGDKTLSVRQLSQQMARLPENVPVTLVMVQCHSGGFANLQFEGGLPDGRPIARDFAGFFASEPDRLAAGCTAETDEAEYHDFTSYFFAALTGRDRIGRIVTGADYNGDGRIGMNEAFCYTLANDRSIDTPVCGSDIFLRRFAFMSEKALDAIPFRSVHAWATAAQRCALDALAKSLRYEQGENRLKRAAHDLDAKEGAAAVGPSRREMRRILDEQRTDAQRTLLARWPDLRDASLPDYPVAKKQAIKYLEANQNSAKWRALLAASDALTHTDIAEEAQEIAAAHLLRFVTLGHSVIRAHHLRQTASAATKARFERLIQAEAGSPLPPAEAPAALHH